MKKFNNSNKSCKSKNKVNLFLQNFNWHQNRVKFDICRYLWFHEISISNDKDNNTRLMPFFTIISFFNFPFFLISLSFTILTNLLIKTFCSHSGLLNSMNTLSPKLGEFKLVKFHLIGNFQLVWSYWRITKKFFVSR